MRPKLTILIFVVLMAASATARLSADERLDDIGRLQGTWTLMYQERDGFAAPLGSFIGFRLGVRSNHYIFAVGNMPTGGGAFAVNAETWPWPRQIDYMSLAGPDTGQVYLGIYDVVGSIHKVCLSPPGQPRPASFTTFPGSGQTLYVWLHVGP